jgi:hypothetical protein
MEMINSKIIKCYQLEKMERDGKGSSHLVIYRLEPLQVVNVNAKLHDAKVDSPLYS